ncbi:hypothetical protein BaOVIS_002820 [Babesia ovis]|uniref:Uncharacterized protein n=1 Tax=Babesia ovis TaxID=5869 RepID=A0A9W5T9Y5_BABOV|nr:hypothetical protein BaOVIS_002820 [Babesia ovis]
MSASPSTLMLRGDRASYGDAATVSDYPTRDQRKQPFARQKRQYNATDGATSSPFTKANRRGGATGDGDTAESRQEASSTPAQRCSNKGQNKAPRKRSARLKSLEIDDNDLPDSTDVSLDVSQASSKNDDDLGSMDDVNSTKDTTYSAKRSHKSMSDSTGGVDSGANNRKTFLIDSTLLDEALNATDIAKAQSDFQDLDSLSLSHSHGASQTGSVDEEDDKRRKKRKCSRLQDTITRVLAKARADVIHLDEKIATLESQYFTQPDDATGLIKGWESSLIGGIYPSSHSSKARKGMPPKAKQFLGKAQALINEHIFSITSSTCNVSKKLFKQA